MNTTVLNMVGGPGSGKSTTAAAVFAALKHKGINTELVQEYVKAWAWQGRKIGDFDQLYILGKQAHHESRLFDKVDYIVSDSPVMLSAFYENYYGKPQIVKYAVLDYLRAAKAAGVHHRYYLLRRHKPFNPAGRYETEEQARHVDQELQWFMDHLCIPYTVIDEPDTTRAFFVLKDLKIL